MQKILRACRARVFSIEAVLFSQAYFNKGSTISTPLYTHTIQNKEDRMSVLRTILYELPEEVLPLECGAVPSPVAELVLAVPDSLQRPLRDGSHHTAIAMASTQRRLVLSQEAQAGAAGASCSRGSSTGLLYSKSPVCLCICVCCCCVCMCVCLCCLSLCSYACLSWLLLLCVCMFVCVSCFCACVW